LLMQAQGADILDVGGESTRPGAPAISAEEEIDRIGPVLTALQKQVDLLISIDTTKAAVAECALNLGASIINDITGLTRDPAMLPLAASSGAGVAVMHMQGTPQTMQTEPAYANVVDEVGDFFASRLNLLRERGVREECIAFDPGIGFGKTLDHNLALMAGLPAYKKFHRPLLVGLSRKSFLGILTAKDVHLRLPGGLSAAVYAVTRGAHILRVHDVDEAKDAARVVDALREKEEELERGNTGTDHSD